MADDLDQLLDEVETRFCRAPGSNGTEPAGSPAGKALKNRTSNASVAVSKHDDIDGMIEDIFNDVSFDDKHVKPKAKSSHQSPVGTFTHMRSKKCFPVYLGGSSTPFGLGTYSSQRTCNQLRCTACDFSIISYDDHQWDKSCDYLFFRNNMPDLEKLKVKMIRKKGSRSYACQCSWRSIQELTEIQTDQQLRWVCGQHTE